MSEALDKLSPRGREVLTLVAKGLPNWEVARNLRPQIGEETVKTHLRRVYQKLRVTNRVEAVAIWLSVDES